MSSENKEIIEDKIYKQQAHIDQLARKSFIMRKIEQPKDEQELQLLKRIEKARQEREETKIIQSRSISSPQFWQVFMKRHYDLGAWLLLDVTTNFALYFFDTIRVRTQAYNKYMDISHFNQNNVKNLPIYSGLHYKLSYIILSDILRSFTNQVRYQLFMDPSSQFSNYNQLTKILIHGLIAETTITTLLLPIEIRKMIVQMGSFDANLNHYIKSYMRCYFPALIRDSLFFVSHSLTYNLLMYGDHYVSALFRSGEFTPPPTILRGERERKFTCILGSLGLSILLTNPFDVLVTKLATQRNEAYTNPFQAFKFIISQEGWSKLIASAISQRIGFYFLKGLVFFSYQDRVYSMFHDAFNYE
ncbi:unnamed protein product [Paramecium primaurelia]|uniref:Uncharacterized protein n=1 Tax=Paramecium primaurelia TaxID=5886 RepID=A0A8S1PJ21_PARPR|nr:unnamed protein product [Paramecium primaurelia]